MNAATPGETPRPLESRIGQTLARRYQLVALLGAGQEGRVFTAQDLHTSTPVAVKWLSHLPEDLHDIEGARLVALEHPHLVRVLDIVREGDEVFVVQEFVEGGELARRSRPLEVEAVETLAEQMLTALAFLHGQGILHGDVKPENIFVARDAPPHFKLGDFGLARRSVDVVRGVTRGSPAFMPPEIIRGDPDDERSDLYSLGVTLYEAMFGELPFAGPTIREMLQQHLTTIPPRLQRPGDLPGHLVRLVRSLLEKDPARRPRGARQALEAWRGEEAARPTWVPPRLGVLVGRDAELAQLEAWVREGTAVTVVEGVAGSGKTRLLEELRVHLELAGIPVVWWGEAQLGGGTSSAGTTVWVPEAARHHGAEAQARAVFAGLGAGPWVLLVDGFEESEAGPSNVLDYLVREVASESTPGRHVILAGRETTSAAVTAMLARGAFPEPQVLRLQPWGPEALAEAVAALLGSSRIDPSVVDSLQRVTGGLPAGVEFVCAEMVRRGALRVDASGRLTLAAEFDPADMPGDWLQAGLHRLDTAERTLLRYLALLEQPAPWHLLESLVEDPAPTIATLRRAGFVRERRQEGAAGALELAHTGVRRVVLQELDADTARRMHCRLAACLAADRRTATGEAVDWHRALGEALPEARAALARLRASLRDRQPERLLRAYDAVLERWPLDVEAPGRLATEVERLDLMLDLGRFAAAEARAQAALATARAAPAEQALRWRLGYALYGQARLEEALRCFESATRVADAPPLSVAPPGRHAATPDALAAELARVRILLELGQVDAAQHACEALAARVPRTHPRYPEFFAVQMLVLRETDGLDEARRVLEVLRREAEDEGTDRNDPFWAEVYTNLGLVAWGHGRMEEAHAHFRQAEARYAALGNRFGRARVLNALAVVAAEMGDFATARESFRRGLDLCRRLGDGLNVVHYLANLGQMHGVQGSYHEAIRHADEALAACRAMDLGRPVPRILLIRAGIYAQLGAREPCERDLRQLQEAAVAERYAALAAMIRADLALRRGELDTVSSDLDEAEAVLQRDEVEDELVRLRALRARFEAHRGDPERARATIRGVAADAARLRLPDRVVKAEVLATEWLLESDPGLAGERGAKALVAAQHLGLRDAQWRLERVLGVVAGTRGDMHEAVGHFQQAVLTLREMLEGLPDELRRAFLALPDVRRALAEMESMR